MTKWWNLVETMGRGEREEEKRRRKRGNLRKIIHKTHIIH